MGPFVNLDNMVTWTPPAVPGLEHADHAKQHTSISSPELSFPSPPASAPCDQVSHEPICISSDDESTFDADEEAGYDGSRDMDGSRSDDTLPSIDTIFASIKKSSSVLSPTRSSNDANQPQLLDPGASRPSQEAVTGPDVLLSRTPTSTQASSDMLGHSSGSPGYTGLVTKGDAVIPGHLPEMLEASCSESCEASNAVAIPPQNGMEQTRDDSQSTLGSCSDGRSDSQSSSDSDGPMRQRREDSLIPSTSLSLDIREKEEAYGDAEEAIDDDVSQLLTGQLRCKGTHKDRFAPEQDPASHCDSNADASSSSGADAAVHDDEDYCPSPCRGEREQASNNSVDDEADRSDPPLPCKRRKLGGSQSSSRPYRRSKRLTNRTQTVNSSGLHTPVRSVSSVSSNSAFTAADEEMPVARYEEWPLQGATLKRLAMNGKMTFQLQFGWEPCVGGHAPGSHSDDKFQSQVAKRSHRTQRSPASHSFTCEEDDLIVKLKEEQQLRWPEIHEQFSDKFPQRRSQGSLQVRYCTKLKSGKRAEKSRQGQATR
ncbi:unnamed protein product [Clonostachys rosea f. rosea IK726]|uniref:Uncharacterized protein n=1 Tax=Clonostachys rosea f. rosea IK726 TaxID=1349383 RepID=A0ACA9USD8_BIOOC|nr:unnamed protein product [Clonostachys rosea f. rosea IK726]